MLPIAIRRTAHAGLPASRVELFAELLVWGSLVCRPFIAFSGLMHVSGQADTQAPGLWQSVSKSRTDRRSATLSTYATRWEPRLSTLPRGEAPVCEDTFTLPGPVVTAKESAALTALASQYSDIGRLAPVGRLPGRLLTGLEPYFESADDDGRLVFAFSDAGAFLSALVSAGTAFRVQSPAWLRRRLVAAADKLAEANCERPAPAAEGGSAQYDITCRTAPVTLMVSQMMGMTGIGFHFIVHEECCPSSVTVYDWTSEHQQAMARIGVFAELNMAEPGTPIYDAARRHTIQRVRESVDRGIGAILWGVDTGEFGVAYGYDDDDQVLLVSGVASAGSDSGLTQGRTESPARQPELVVAPALRHLYR